MNRHQRRTLAAQDRRQARRRAGTVIASPILTALLVAGIAHGAPQQPGLGDDAGQPGLAAPAVPQVQPAPAPDDYWVAPPTQYRDLEYVPIPNYDYGQNRYTAPSDPVDFGQLHLPVAVDPSNPLIAPVNRGRLGDYQFDKPNWMSQDDLDRTNNTSAVIEAQVTDFWRSIGVPTDRAQRLASTQIAAGAGGFVAGATAVGVPTAIVSGAIGCGIGAAIGAGIGYATTAGLGTLPGAGIGCLVGGGSTALVVGGLGALGGGAGGAALAVAGVTPFAAGDLGEPIEMDVPNVEQAAITAQTQQVVQAIAADPVGAQVIDQVQQVIESAPSVDEQARDWVAAQPGGQDVLNGVDAWVQTMEPTTPGIASGLTVDALISGLIPAA